MKHYVVVAALLVVCTVLGRLLLPLLSITDVAMLYLATVGLAAALVGRGASVFAALLAIALFDFFFVPPHFTFAVDDLHYVLTFALMLGSALTIGEVANRLRAFADAARERERRTAALYAMTGELDPTAGLDALIGVVTRHVRDAFSARVQILLRGPDGLVAVPSGAAPAYPLNDTEWGAARWTFDHWQAAGTGTQNVAAAQALYLPLIGAAGRVGVLGVRPEDGSDFHNATVRQVVETFAGQAARALEHADAAIKESAGSRTGE
jgi:two-component system sensor histidine kinase KdpD